MIASVTAGEAARGLVAHGVTHAGRQRSNNEDCLLIDGELGLYLVLDGMGGHSAGDVASALGRDAVRAFIAARRGSLAPRQLLTEAVVAASAAIHRHAQEHRERHGMGTTIVGCLAVAPVADATVQTAADAPALLIAHVGDSRAYLLRDGELRQLTRDHTVVAELVARGAITADDAERHPYKSVLSRNLGARPEAEPELVELPLAPGDRVLLCSDGLNGYAAHHAIEQILGGARDPARAASDLVELALRGGGGDNVTCVVIEVEPAAPEPTAVLRGHAAAAWARGRERFLEAARAGGVASSPICAVLSADEAIAIVAGNLFEAIAHDLEQTTGIYVWTFAENLAAGWLDQGGGFGELRRLLDQLGAAVDAVVADEAGRDAALALVLEATVVRALVVAEMAVAAVVGGRLRAIEDALATIHDVPLTEPDAAVQIERNIVGGAAPVGATRTHTAAAATAADLAGDDWRGRATAEVAACLEAAVVEADRRARRADAALDIARCLAATHRSALGGEVALVDAAQELFGDRTLAEVALAPLIDALDRARRVHLAAAGAVPATAAARRGALGRLAIAHQRLFAAVVELAADAAGAVADGVRASAERSAALRARLGDGEAELSRLERAVDAADRRAATARDTADTIETAGADGGERAATARDTLETAPRSER